jgi:hypothetical protein
VRRAPGTSRLDAACTAGDRASASDHRNERHADPRALRHHEVQRPRAKDAPRGKTRTDVGKARTKTFYIWRWGCGDKVLPDAIMSAGVDYTKE